VTLDEHNANVRKWRSWLKEQREEREREEQVAEEEQSAQQPAADSEELKASLDDQGNTAAPLPTGAEPEAALTGTAAAGENGEAGDAPASQFRVVEVDGRRVPIPIAKPAQN
jgi:hypothetical protein